MNILIAGGAGFIGSHACEYFLSRNNSVVVFDNFSSGNKLNLSHLTGGKLTVIEGDIRSHILVEKVFYDNKIDAVLNFAAQVSVPESVLNPGETYEVNITGTNNLLETAGRSGIKVFMHASSAAIYGDDPVLPKNEEMVPSPKSPYAISKITGEFLNSYCGMKYGFTAINCRFFNVFGPRQNPNAAYAAAVPIFINRVLNNEPVTIYGDGEQTRDFIFVTDLISAIDYLTHHNFKSFAKALTFNLGYGRSITINNLLKIICDKTGRDAPAQYVTERSGDIKHSFASVEKLTKTGWIPQFDLEKGIELTCKHMLSSLKNSRTE